MGHEDLCETGLVLGLGCAANVESRSIPNHHHEKASRKFHHRSWISLEPSLTLSLADDAYKGPKKNNVNKLRGEETSVVVRQPSPYSPVSSFSNTCIKREKEGGSEGVELERVSLRVSDEDEEGCVRKKLRLTKEQSALLEDSFKDHSTLNPKQKQELAKRLNLRPRQVEVWFQNRRARTKLKQTEVDCELLKRCCEALKDENRRLQKEVQELKAMNFVSPFYMRLPAATLTMCPSCERISSGGGHNGIDLAKNPFPMPSKPHHLYNPFTHSSAAC